MFIYMKETKTYWSFEKNEMGIETLVQIQQKIIRGILSTEGMNEKKEKKGGIENLQHRDKFPQFCVIIINFLE